MAVMKSYRVFMDRRGYQPSSSAKVVKQRRGPVTLPRSLTTAPIVVVVGEELKKFYIHKTYLCASSAFLKNHIKPEWNSEEVKLLTINPAAFKIYADWLYQDFVGIGKDEGTVEPDPGEAKYSEVEWTKWVECYELSSFLQDTDFSDALIDFAIDKMSADEEYIDNLPNVIYPNTTRNSPHRQLAVDLAATVWQQTSLQGVHEDNSMTEFVTDLSVAALRALRRGGIERVGAYDFFKGKNTCLYHEHTLNEGPCYKVKRGLP